MLTQILCILLFVAKSLQHDDGPNSSQMCVAACQSSLDEVTFGTTVHTDDYYTGYCEDTLKWESTYICSKLYCTPYQIQRGVDYALLVCRTKVHVDVVSYADVIANYSDAAIEAMPRLDYSVEPPTDIYNNTIIPTRDFYDRSFKTYTEWMVVEKQHNDYSYALCGFWGIVLLIGMINRLFALIVYRTSASTRGNTEAVSERRIQSSKSPFGKVKRLVKQHIILPAIFGYRHQVPWGWCTVPTRIQTFLIFAYVLLNIILSAVRYQSFDDNVWFTNQHDQIWTYVTDRTGILAVVNFPLLWVFAGRNDVLLWLTGWSFGTFNMFHRWLARIATVEAIIHSIGYTYLTVEDGGTAALAESMKEQYWYCGVVATICMSFLLLFSIYPLRKSVYELFLGLHVGLAVMTLVTVYYHIIIWDGKFEPYIWPCVAVWSFDHFIRMMRLLVLNYKTLFFRHTKVRAVYNADHDIIRLTFTPSYHRQPQPGAHYYLHFPFILRAIGNSPFTMSGWSKGGEHNPGTSVFETSISGSQEKGNLPSTEIEVNSESNGSLESKSGPTKIHFVVRPYKGLTAHLKNHILKSGSSTREITAMIEGPYGETHPVFHYNHIIFISGGSGVSAVLPYMQQYLHPETYHSSFSSVTKRVRVIWAAREAAFIRDVIDRELAGAASNSTVKLDLYVTGPSPVPIKDDTLDLDRFPGHIDLHYKRPDVQTIVRQEVGESVGSVAILVCGPARLADDARRAAVDMTGAGYDIGYFEECFGW